MRYVYEIEKLGNKKQNNLDYIMRESYKFSPV